MPEREARDPVCHRTIHPVSGYEQTDYLGKTYYFCDEACRKTFQRDPAKALDGDRLWETQHSAEAAGQPTDHSADIEFLKRRSHGTSPGFVELAATPQSLEAAIWLRELYQVGIDARVTRRRLDVTDSIAALWRVQFLYSLQVTEEDEARGLAFLRARRFIE